MSRAPKEVIWRADPHTIAKIEIVRRYLYKWAVIVGTTFCSKPLTYIDGFAGPGEYVNHPTGSPLAALEALNEAKKKGGERWCASMIRAMFIEQDSGRLSHLQALIEERKAAGDVNWVPQNSSFVEGLAHAESQFAKAFYTSAPLVVFVDPFGATGFPWESIVRILSSKTSEIILNFDADGMTRIAAAGNRANADEILTTVFGGDEWKTAIQNNRGTRDKMLALLELYKKKLRSIPNVNYVFAFEMASASSSIDYYLLFASQSQLGLEKMKETMRELDRSGQYRFCDATRHQSTLFRFDNPEDWTSRLVEDLGGKELS